MNVARTLIRRSHPGLYSTKHKFRGALYGFEQLEDRITPAEGSPYGDIPAWSTWGTVEASNGAVQSILDNARAVASIGSGNSTGGSSYTPITYIPPSPPPVDQTPYLDTTTAILLAYLLTLYSDSSSDPQEPEPKPPFMDKATELESGVSELISTAYVPDPQNSGNPKSVGNSGSSAPSISANGQYVAFMSEASNLVPTDTNGKRDIFVKQRETGAIIRISLSVDGTEANGDSDRPSISADGRYVVFESEATNLVPGGTTGREIFVGDLLTGSIALLSSSAAGIEGDEDSYNASISSDGRYVAFQSSSGNLTPQSSKGSSDIYVKDRFTGEVKLASSTKEGFGGNDSSYSPVISADGNYVAFASGATDLVSGDANGREESDVYVKNLMTGSVSRVSTSIEGKQGNYYSHSPSISADGRYVAFVSAATNLVANDTNKSEDVFVKDLQTGTISRASRSASNRAGNDWSMSPSISADGRFVAFLSDATNLVSGDTNSRKDVFLKDMLTGAITRLSAGPDESDQNTSSYNKPSISAYGWYVVFESGVTNLVPNDTNEQLDIFLSTPLGDPPTITRIENQIAFLGQAANISIQLSDLDEPSEGLKVIAFSGNSQIIPNESIIVSGTGANRVVSITPVGSGDTSISLAVVDSVGYSQVTKFKISVPVPNPAPNPPGTIPTTPPTISPPTTPTSSHDGPLTRTVTVAGGNMAVVQSFTLDAAGNVVDTGNRISAYAGFEGPFRVATADLTRDNTPDVIVGSSPGMPDDVRVFDGSTDTLIFEMIIKPFEGNFFGGVYVASGDFTGDGVPEIIVSPDQGGGPRVIVYEVSSGTPVVLADFYGIEDDSFRGGARVAVGDVSGDGKIDLIVAAGFGGGPRVTIWDGKSIAQSANQKPSSSPFANFFAFESTLRNGTYVSSADLNQDRVDDLVFGAGPGGGPRVMAIDSLQLLQSGSDAAISNPITNFFAEDENQRGGVRVKAISSTPQAQALIVTGSGDSSRWKVFSTSPQNQSTLTAEFDAFGTANLDGVYVG